VAARAASGVFQRDAEVQADRLGMADVQVAVGFRREAGDDVRPRRGVFAAWRSRSSAMIIADELESFGA
jgi:hypothetical protein